MDAQRPAEIRQLLNDATLDPQCGTDTREIFFRTDEAHYKADVRLHREARWIILELLAEVEHLSTANMTLATIDKWVREDSADASAHGVYCATVRQVTALQDDNARLEWLAATCGFMDG